MRRIQLRQRGFRKQGEAYTGENHNKEVDFTVPELKIEDLRPKKKVTKKETVVEKVVKAVKKAVRKKK